VTDYSGSTTGTRTYNMTYQTQYWSWPAYYILNRPMLTTVTPAGGSAFTLANTTYGGGTMIASSATSNHDPAYTANGGPPRGNPWCVSGLGGIDGVCT
jgi:hypothetical protein